MRTPVRAAIALDLCAARRCCSGRASRPAARFAAGPLTYLGHDAVHSPLLDLVYGWAQLLRDPNVRDLLGLADALLADHGAATARLAEAAIATARLGDAQAPPWDDLVPVIRQIVASPALVRAPLDALQQPRPRSSAGGSPTS